MPKIFISYSHDSQEHSERVLSLSERLRQDGIVTSLDQYVKGTPPQRWPRWMLDQVDWADYVLLVCTENYYSRFRGHDLPGRGKGADWEGCVIMQEIYDQQNTSTKFVPTTFDPSNERFIPQPVRGHTHYVLNSEKNYQRLLDFLLDVAGVEPGLIGDPPKREKKLVAPLTFDNTLSPTADAKDSPAKGEAAKKNESSFYLFASPTGKPDASPAEVFYEVKGKPVADFLCRLFTREYADEVGQPVFHHKAASDISLEERILMDETLDWLAPYYEDPDPGVYDPEPSSDVMLRAEYGLRAAKWARSVRERIEEIGRNEGQDTSSSARESSSATAELPEMPVEERRSSGLILLMLLAQAYYRTLECTISMASWCTALDLELNQSYLWTIAAITNLLKNHEDLKDFPGPFEPIFPDLYPSTIRDTDWEDMVAPDAERFLSTVQQYVHSKGITDPPKGSPGWIFIELFRPSVNETIKRAIAYNKRMHQYRQRALSPSPASHRGK